MTTSEVWAKGAEWLAGGDAAQVARTRGYLGRLVKTHGLPAVAEALAAGQALAPKRPRAWLYAALAKPDGGEVWREGVAWLTAGDPAQERQARAVLGALVKAHGLPAVARAVAAGRAHMRPVRDPGAWLAGALLRESGDSAEAREARRQRTRVLL